MALPALVTYLLATATLPLVQLVRAAPVNLAGSGVQDHAIASVERRATTTTTPMTAAQELSYRPAALFASAAYCLPTETINWSCGGKLRSTSKTPVVGFLPGPVSSARIYRGRASKRTADSRWYSCTQSIDK